MVLSLPCFSVLLGMRAFGCCAAHCELWLVDSSVCLSHDARWNEVSGVQHDFAVQALGTRCMSSDVSERPNFDEILQLVDELDVES